MKKPVKFNLKDLAALAIPTDQQKQIKGGDDGDDDVIIIDDVVIG